LLPSLEAPDFFPAATANSDFPSGPLAAAWRFRAARRIFKRLARSRLSRLVNAGSSVWRNFDVQNADAWFDLGSLYQFPENLGLGSARFLGQLRQLNTLYVTEPEIKKTSAFQVPSVVQ